LRELLEQHCEDLKEGREGREGKGSEDKGLRAAEGDLRGVEGAEREVSWRHEKGWEGGEGD
jgi:hypothetical protein